ncbi:hypothetical protein EV356DRAFT_568547 [Viridothelium virens]|uniref:F-box domain-containing protein n=1 Tax=Viridothelium virens TaxID=1048519 RepID=A0A6A6H422_VIRVR|nr:hypothetical protein EV356DRAFT_568547 [Viridothelium virens]
MPFLMSIPNESRLSLLQLPVDILFYLNTFLPPSSVVALALTSKALYHTVPHRNLLADHDSPAPHVASLTKHKDLEHQQRKRQPPTTPPLASATTVNVKPQHHLKPPVHSPTPPHSPTPESCSKRAIRTFLRHDTTSATSRRCSLCKNVLPLDLFTGNTGFRGVPKPEEFCFWCAAHLARVVVLPPDLSARETSALTRSCWYRSRERMCMHCGSVAIWDGRGGEDQRGCGCGCECETCWFRDVEVFTRFVGSWEQYPSYDFKNGRDGELMVRETTAGILSREGRAMRDFGIRAEDVPVFSVNMAKG